MSDTVFNVEVAEFDVVVDDPELGVVLIEGAQGPVGAKGDKGDQGDPGPLGPGFA